MATQRAGRPTVWMGSSTSANISGRLVWHHLPPATSRKQPQRNLAAGHTKNMWLESSGVKHKGHIPSEGLLRFSTSIPDGIRLRTNCQRKILIFNGSLISQRRFNSIGPGVGIIAWYSDFAENRPLGSRYQWTTSSSSDGEWRAMHAMRSSHISSSPGPKVLLKAICVRFDKADATVKHLSAQILKRAWKREANGKEPHHRSNQKRVAVPRPTSIDYLIRSTGINCTIVCQNCDLPALCANARGWPRRYLAQIMSSHRPPSPEAILHSHLARRAIFILLDEMIPRPPSPWACRSPSTSP